MSASGNRKQTSQEAFWAGDFGDAYIDRSKGQAGGMDRVHHFFTTCLAGVEPPGSVLELGANIGRNLVALRNLYPESRLEAVEINARAVAALEGLRREKIVDRVHAGSILDHVPDRHFDLVFTRGVLIHISPEDLERVYRLMHRASGRYVLMSEYYSKTPVAIPYRGHDNQLFKRDFAGEFMDLFPDVRLVDYGFFYHRSPTHPIDDQNWFLMEKTCS